MYNPILTPNLGSKTLVAYFMLKRYANTWLGPIVCPNLNISSVMVNMLNDWLETGEARWCGAQTRSDQAPSWAAPIIPHQPSLSPGQIVTRLISHRAMLKHKLRKSRKNILSLLDYVQEQEEDAKIPEYSEIKKPGRKEKKKKGINHESGLSMFLDTCCDTHRHNDKNPFIHLWLDP